MLLHLEVFWYDGSGSSETSNRTEKKLNLITFSVETQTFTVLSTVQIPSNLNLQNVFLQQMPYGVKHNQYNIPCRAWWR